MRSVDITLQLDPDGGARSATAVARVDCPPEQLWRVVQDVEGYAGRVPMIHKVKRDGSRATLHFKFKISLFSMSFEIVMDVARVEGRSLELSWVSGEPAGIHLRFDLEPIEEGRATNLRSTSTFDVMKLGWLAKYFLRHHPEIQLGIVPGVAVGLIESMRTGAGA